MHKSASDSSLNSVQADVNVNVSWMKGPYVWVMYVLLLVAARVLAFYFLTPVLTSEWQWTLIFLAHGAVSFWALHWNRGTPDWSDQGAYIDQTVWEQIDNGTPWTRTRKMFMILPIVLFLLCSHYTGYDKLHLGINAVMLAVLLIAKLPEMHGVRIGGLNKAPVDAE